MFPKPSEIPSEATISNLSSHHILCLVGSPNAWFLVPTTNQERRFAYDANLRGFKLAIIQYKRLSSINAYGGVSFSVDPSQHGTLTSNFPARGKSYVFYAYSNHKEYQSLAFDYEQIGSPQFMTSMVFIDAHAVPTGVSTIREFPDGVVRAHIGGGQYSPPFAVADGIQFAARLRSCSFGLTGSAAKRAVGTDFWEAADAPANLHYFLWKME